MVQQKMQAMLYEGPGRLNFSQVPIPEISPGEVLVKIKTALTCGTDVKTYQRGHHLLIPPTPFGHEFAGDIAAIGRKVKNFTEGMRVVAANSAPCDTCFFCKKNQQNLCEDILFNWGAFAEYIRIPERIVKKNLYIIPENLSYEEAALTEPLACVILGNEAAEIQAGETVVIAGGTGPIGLLHLQLAVQQRAKEVFVIGLKDKRWPIAKELGATRLIDALAKDPVARVGELTGGRGVDIVIESAGLPQVWEMTPKLVRKGGRIVLFGGPPKETKVTFDTARIHYGNLTLQGIFHHTPRTVKRALALLSSGTIKTKPLISREMPLEKLEEALKLMTKGEVVKVAIRI